MLQPAGVPVLVITENDWNKTAPVFIRQTSASASIESF